MLSWRPLTVTPSPDQLDFQERLRIAPLPPLLVILHGLVDDDLSVRGVDEDLGAFERARRRTFEVDPGAVVAAAVTRAFELVLRREPVGLAAEVCAGSDQGVEHLLVADHPDAVLLLPALVDLPDRVVVGEAGLELLDGLE